MSVRVEKNGPMTSDLLRSLCVLALSPRARLFERSLARARESQARLLAGLLRGSARTEYGRSLRLTGRESYEEFAKKVPIVRYEQLERWITRQRESGGTVISPTRVRVYEKTSGSSGAKKYIPYTQGLLRSFHTLVFVWLHDLMRNGPGFRTGKVFFSISQPFQQPEVNRDGTPVGMGNDQDYLSPLTRFFLGSCLIAPPGISSLRDPHAYKRVLACALLAEERLELLSIWNPTYLTSLMDFIDENRELLIADLRRGGLSAEGMSFRFRVIQAERAAILREPAISWTRLWPELKLISCWTDGTAGFFARRLHREFPGVSVQGKGLLATEAPMTVPLVRAPGPVPLVDEIFFEFEEEDGKIHLLHELREGCSYELILSQKGGFLRYRMGDRVEVVGRYLGAPCLRFLGRANDVSDLVGEKLNAGFVQSALSRVFPSEDGFSFLVPLRREKGPSYYLCVTSESPAPGAAQVLEEALVEAHHYFQARKLGQLGPVKVATANGAREAYYDHFMSRGMKWGDIKFSPLLKSADETFLRKLGIET